MSSAACNFAFNATFIVIAVILLIWLMKSLEKQKLEDAFHAWQTVAIQVKTAHEGLQNMATDMNLNHSARTQAFKLLTRLEAIERQGANGNS